jgi:glycerol kinase
VIEIIKLDFKSELAHLKVGGGMANVDVAMEVLMWAGLRWCGLRCARVLCLGSALLAGAAIGMFGWDLARPETLACVNTAFCIALGEGGA